MIKMIEQSVGGMDYKISSSNVSSKGKYFSINLTVFVTSEAIRDIIFAKLEDMNLLNGFVNQAPIARL